MQTRWPTSLEIQTRSILFPTMNCPIFWLTLKRFGPGSGFGCCKAQ